MKKKNCNFSFRRYICSTIKSLNNNNKTWILILKERNRELFVSSS